MLVEDDPVLRDDIFVPGLTREGLDVTAVGSAADLYRGLLGQTFDVVVLDVGLPDGDGFDIARHLRSMSALGIVMLTGRDSSRDRVQGLDSGADAYLTKPIEVDVLAATLHSLVRRIRSAAPPAATWRLSAEDWRLLTPQGADVDLTVPERAILQCLFATLGRPVPRQRLIASLVDNVHDFDPRRLDMLVYRLRKKVEEATGTGLPLRAVRGNGYLLTVTAD